ncbi:MAG: metallophosphoesterase [Steroidobacteraceae bacterium]
MRRRRLYWLIAILGLLHAYVGWRLLPDLPVAAGARLAGALYLALSLGVMALGLRVRSLARRPWSDWIAVAGLSAAGLFSSLCVLTVLRDLLLLAVIFPLSAGPFHLFEAASSAAVVALALSATGVGFANARRRARIVDVDIPLDGLPPALAGFTIAQVSDVHVGRTIRRKYVEAIVRAVNALEADLIALTGDLVDGPVEELAADVAPLAGLEARYGACFVTGNHEYYSGEPAWRVELERLGLRVLNNQHWVIMHRGAQIVVAGVTDFSAERFDARQKSDPEAALRGAPSDAGARILLAHQPRTAPAAARAGFDLQLSGHTHGGQFWPWTHFVRFQQPFTAGLNRLGRLWVYTSRGTGYWGPPKRFGAPSEITRLRLVPMAEDAAAPCARGRGRGRGRDGTGARGRIGVRGPAGARPPRPIATPESVS